MTPFRATVRTTSLQVERRQRHQPAARGNARLQLQNSHRGRQPEAAGRIQTAALILAALIEGVALFGVVIAFVIQGKF